MADILHGSARTTPRVRAELQASKETAGSLARRYGLSRTTVAKWRSRTTTADAPMGPRDPKSTVLTPVQEAMIVEFRRRTLLPLDDVLGCLKDSVPELRRSSLHRCLVRHGISRLPESGDEGFQARTVRRHDDRLRPRRYLRAAARRRQAQHVPGDRPRLEVHLCRIPRERRQDGYLVVDYDQLGLHMETWAKWVAAGQRVPTTASIRH